MDYRFFLKKYFVEKFVAKVNLDFNYLVNPNKTGLFEGSF